MNIRGVVPTIGGRLTGRFLAHCEDLLAGLFRDIKPGFGGFLIALLTISPMVTGCQTIRELLGFGIQKPRVSVLAMAVKKVTLSELDLLVQLRADNPNEIDLEFESLAYQVAIEQTPVATGEYRSPIKLLAESNLRIELPLKISTQNALAILERLIKNPDAGTQVHFAANVVFKSPLGPLSLEFKESKPLVKQ